MSITTVWKTVLTERNEQYKANYNFNCMASHLEFGNNWMGTEPIIMKYETTRQHKHNQPATVVSGKNKVLKTATQHFSPITLEVGNWN